MAFSKFLRAAEGSETVASGRAHDRIDGTAAPDAIAAPESKLDLLTNLLDREDDDRAHHHK